MSLAPLVAAFERACSDAQVASTRAAAEHALLALAARPDAVALALAVAESTRSPVARFHAAATLRSAAKDRWPSLPPHQRYGHSSLRYWLVNNVVATSFLVSFERLALLRTAAFLTRRAYLEETPRDRHTFLALVGKTAASPDSAHHAAVAAAELMDLIVEEFLTPSLSVGASGLDREMLTRARQQFADPTGDIVQMFSAAKDSLALLVSRPPSSQEHFEARAAPTLSTILKIVTMDPESLSFTLDDGTLLDALNSDDTAGEPLEAVVINTFEDPCWAPLVDHIPHLLRIAFAISASQIASVDDENDAEILLKVCQLTIAIASIKHSSYRPDTNAATDLLACILTGIEEQNWSSSHLGLVRLAYAEVWRRVSCAHGLSNVECLPDLHIHLFTKNTCDEMKNVAMCLARQEPDDDICSMDVTDMLLETWANLALQADDGSLSADHTLSSNVEQVVIHCIRMSLRSTDEATAASQRTRQSDGEEDFGFDDLSIDESRISMTSILVRFVLDRTVGLITNSLLGVAGCVFNWASTKARLANPLDLYQEDLYFLIRLTGTVLADEARGESPSIPAQFVVPSGTGPNGCTKQGMHVHTLIRTIMDVAQGETNLLHRAGAHCQEASPRVGTAILDTLSRICRTYLVPVGEVSNPTALQVAGGPQVTESGINLCFQKAAEGLSRRAVESDVAEGAATLLSTLATATRYYPKLQESQCWQQLLQQGAEAYQTMSVTAVQDLGKSLTTVLGDTVAERFLIPAYNSLSDCASMHDSDPHAADRAIATLNLLNGATVAESIGILTRKALLHALEAPNGNAASCAKAFGRNRPDVSRNLIILAECIVQTNLAALEEDEVHSVVANCVKLIALHTEIVESLKGTLSVDEVGSDLEDLIALLNRILDEECDTDVGEECYYGLSTVLSIMSDDVLELPAVSAAFFRFVTLLVRRHPEKLFKLQPDMCKQLLQMIEVQRGSMDISSERRGLEAIAALSRSWIAGNKEGPAQEVVHSALRDFTGSIFNGVATGSAHTSNIDAAADALLPLLHVKYAGSTSAVEDLGQALLASCGNHEKVRSALQNLAQASSQAASMCAYSGSEHINDHPTTRRTVRLQAMKSFRLAVARFSSSARDGLMCFALVPADAT